MKILNVSDKFFCNYYLLRISKLGNKSFPELLPYLGTTVRLFPIKLWYGISVYYCLLYMYCHTLQELESCESGIVSASISQPVKMWMELNRHSAGSKSFRISYHVNCSLQWTCICMYILYQMKVNCHWSRLLVYNGIQLNAVELHHLHSWCMRKYLY